MTRRLSLRRCVLALLCFAVFFSLSFTPYRIGDYFDYRDRFSGDISREDITAAKEHLASLEYYHNLNKRLEVVMLDQIAEKYLFQDAKFYRGAYMYISRDWSSVLDELEQEEGFWAYYIRANARWRQAQDMYANALNLSDQARKEDQLKKADEISKSTKDDYLMAIKTDPDNTLEPKWNYDLITDDNARMNALKPQPAEKKIKFGIPGPGGSGEGPEGEKNKGDKSHKPEDLDRKGGQRPGKAQGKPEKTG